MGSSKRITKSKVGSKDIDMDYIGSREESAEARTIKSRERLRDKMNDDVEAFLASGGQINQVDPHVTATPPQKPETNYGNRPI